MKAVWVSHDTIIQNSILDSNVEFAKIIRPNIEIVQLKYVRPLLGVDLFNALDQHVYNEINGLGQIPTNYKTLLIDYVEKVIIHYTLYELSKKSVYKLTNIGLVLKENDKSTPATASQSQLVSDDDKSNAEFFAAELIKYLNDNKVLFPEYLTNTTNSEAPKKNSYDVDMFFY